MTVKELIRSAVRKLTHDENEPTASEYADGLIVLNAMLGQWKTKEWLVYRQYTALTDTLTHPAEYEQPMIYNLAIILADDYGIQPSAVVVSKAREGLANIHRQSLRPVEQAETQLFREDIYRSKYTYDIDTNEF